MGANTLTLICKLLMTLTIVNGWDKKGRSTGKVGDLFYKKDGFSLGSFHESCHFDCQKFSPKMVEFTFVIPKGARCPHTVSLGTELADLKEDHHICDNKVIFCRKISFTNDTK